MEAGLKSHIIFSELCPLTAQCEGYFLKEKFN